MKCTFLSLRARCRASGKRRAAAPRLAAALRPFLLDGPCPLLPPLLPCNALQQHANRYCILAASIVVDDSKRQLKYTQPVAIFRFCVNHRTIEASGF